MSSPCDYFFKREVNYIKLAFPFLVERRYGKIVSVASVVRKECSAIGFSHYGDKERSIIALSYSLAKEFGTYDYYRWSI